MKKLYKVPENTVRVIANVDGNYEVRDFDLEEKNIGKIPAIAVGPSVKAATGSYDLTGLELNKPLVSPTQKIINQSPEERLQERLDKTPVDPFIPYAMSMDPDHYMKPCQIGIADIAPGKRLVTADYGEGHIPMTECAIVGDDYGPVGLFVPFCANIDAIDEAADLLNEVYNNYNTRSQSRDVFFDQILGREAPCNCKKLPF